MAIEHTPRLGLTQWTDPDYQDPVHVSQFNADAAALDAFAIEVDTRAPVYVASYLPSDYTPGTDDIAPYVAAAVTKSEETGRGRMVFPPGTHLWNSPIYLNLASRNHVYSFEGHGRGTILRLGPSLDGDFAIYLNHTPGGAAVTTLPTPPRLVVTDCLIESAASATNPSFVYYNQAGSMFERVRFRGLLYAATGEGYTDMMTFRACQWRLPAPGGAMYKQGVDNGDGLVVEQISATIDAVVVDLRNCNGATIDSCIGGVYKFTQCSAVVVTGVHIDTYAATVPAFYIDSSQVVFDGCWNHVAPDAPTWEINDAKQNNFSDVTWRSCYMGFRADDATRERSAHIHIAAVQDDTVLRFENNIGVVWAPNQTTRYKAGFLVTSDVPTVQAAIDDNPAAVLGTSELRFIDTAWTLMAPFPNQARTFRTVTAPIINVAESTNFPSNIPSGTTYYYTVAVIVSGRLGLHTQAAGEASVTTTGADRAVSVGITAKANPALVRIWRGTSTGVYDRYVDVPVSSRQVNLFDTGATLAGYPWITVSVPVVPTTNTTVNGYEMNNQRIVWMQSPPTEGTWSRGDFAHRTAVSAGGKGGLVCVSGGTPGIWKLCLPIDA